MRDSLFKKILAGVIILGLLSTGVLMGYTMYLRSQCSILTYIANEEE